MNVKKKNNGISPFLCLILRVASRTTAQSSTQSKHSTSKNILIQFRKQATEVFQKCFGHKKKKNPKTKIFVGNGKHTYFHILPSYLDANHELWLPKHQSLRKWTKWSTDPFWQHSVTSGQPQQWQGRAGNPPGLTQHPSSCAARTLLHALLAHEQSDSH